MKDLVTLIVLLQLFGCASVTGRDRIIIGVGAGAAVGAVGGAAFSPNSASRPLNALVFGLGGALIGGVGAALTDRGSAIPVGRPVKQTDQTVEKSVQEFQVLPQDQLPAFLRSRVQPMVIEEYIERDSISEDGTLHEPHKAYRIKRQGELLADPVRSQAEGGK